MDEKTESPAHTRIYLTGFMGTGKTTLGPAVARILDWRFVDLDDEIVRAAGRPVAEIFETDGEAGFRSLEREAVRSVTTRERVVVSLGGGAVLDRSNRDLVVRTGVLVCLSARLATLADRLVGEAGIRPLLSDVEGRALRGDALTARIRDLLDARRAAYDAAHVTIDTDRGSIEEVAARIVQAVRGVTRSSDRPDG